MEAAPGHDGFYNNTNCGGDGYSGGRESGDSLDQFFSKGRVQKFMLGKLVDFSIKWVGGVSLVH